MRTFLKIFSHANSKIVFSFLKQNEFLEKTGFYRFYQPIE